MNQRMAMIRPVRAWTTAALALAALGALASTPASAATSGKKSASAKAPAAAKASASAKPDSVLAATGTRTVTSEAMTLKGGEDGTVFRSLTIEGEDRIHIEVERPVLTLGLDPERAPGLEWGSALDVLDRTTPDALAPMVDLSATESSPYVARPWLSHFASGPVARIRPEVKGLEQWKMTIVDERGATAATYTGRGDPPAEITWDGRMSNGASVQPGVTYSYVFEARDKAGNKRNFVGEGFRVPAFRLDTADGPVLVFTGAELNTGKNAPASAAPPIVLEAATALNQVPNTSRRVRVEVTARSQDEAGATAQRLGRWLTPNLVGDPARVDCVALVRPDAPVGGSVRITLAP